MYENNYYTQEGYGSYGMVETVGRYTARTFLWMFAGLAVTFGMAIAGFITGFSFRLLFNSFTYIGPVSYTHLECQLQRLRQPQKDLGELP